MKLALVTGGAGFVGAHLVSRLLDAGYRVRVLDDFSTGSRRRLPSARAGFDCFSGSILDRPWLAEMAKGADLVVHLAAVVGMKMACRNPEYAFRVSSEGTENVLKVTGAAPAVLFSSSCVYGLDYKLRASEADPLLWQECLRYDGGRPSYACGKFMLEKLGRAAQASGREVMILRPFNVVGPGQVGDYGMVLPRFVKRALEERPLIVYGDGLQSRSFSQVGTFAKCFLRLIKTERAWQPKFNPINIGPDLPTPIDELASIVIKETSSRGGIRYQPYQSAYPGMTDVRHRSPATHRLSGLIGPIHWPDIRHVVREFIESERSISAGGMVASVRGASGG